ncbi:MAG: HD-GYP domain-containing protein [Pseudomonadota bacterium]
MSTKAIYLAPEQLCIGIYVHLDLNWLEHDFARNSFKIKTAEQLAQLKRLGLKRIRVDPVRSDARPLPAISTGNGASSMNADGTVKNQSEIEAEIEAESAIAGQAVEESPAMLAKRERIDRIAKQRAAVAQCEAQFLKAATALKSINTNLFSRPAAALESAEQLIQQMLDSILTDKDIAIHLMNDKVAGEEMYFHSLNVAVLAMMLARQLAMPAEDIKQLGVGCLFHDIGKLDIPDRVRMKTEPHTRAERNLMQQHPQYGLGMAAKLGLSREAADIVAQHHEHIDGSGYPHQLKGSQISPLARVVAIVNTYDNLCNQPNFADSVSPYEALSQMFAQQRQHFDAGPLTTFIHCMGVYPPGTIVRLSDDTLGMVVSVNASKPLRPSILIYDAAVPKSEAIIIDLMTEPEVNVAASLKPAQLPREVYDYLSPRKRTTYYLDAPKKGQTARS